MLSHHDRQIVLATLRALADRSVSDRHGVGPGYPVDILPALADAFEEGRADLLASAIEKHGTGDCCVPPISTLR